MYYVYELIDPRDDAVFYVGKGKNGRIDQHEAEARKGRQSRKCDRIRAIECAGLKIKKRKVSTHADEVEAYQAEADLICFYGLANLTNAIPGGIGAMSRGQTIYEDRKVVAEATKLFRRIGVRPPGVINVYGHSLDFSFVPDALKRMVARVAKRRSLDWVNSIAAKHGVTYAYREAA